MSCDYVLVIRDGGTQCATWLPREALEMLRGMGKRSGDFVQLRAPVSELATACPHEIHTVSAQDGLSVRFSVISSFPGRTLLTPRSVGNLTSATTCALHADAQLPNFRSVKTLLEVIQDEWANPTEAPAAPPQLSEKARGKLPMGAPVPGAGTNGTRASGATRSVRFSAQAQPQSSLTDVHRSARLRLLPLLSIESDLTKKLFPELALALTPTAPEGEVLSNGGAPPPPVPGVKEMCVRAGNGWKDVLVKLHKEQKEKVKGKGQNASTTDELTTVLDACREDIVNLWEDQAVRAVLKRRGVRMQDMPGL